MCNSFLAGLALFLVSIPSWSAVEPVTPTTPPKIDHARWETYLRYAEGYVADVKFAFEDPKPSSIPGFYEVVVHLSNGPNKLDRVYYVTADGQGIINGTIWNINDGPFASNLKVLPKEGPSFGPADAPVSMVIFSDFQCPFCSELAKTIRKNLPAKYPNKVHVIFVDFPLASMHPWARAAAEGAHCLADQRPDAFWAFHDWIFDHQKEVNADNLRAKTMDLAQQLSLDQTKVGACLDAHTHAAEIDKSVELGRVLEIHQTPTFFVNGRTESGALDWTRIAALIDFELNRPKQFASQANDEKCCEVAIPKVGGK